MSRTVLTALTALTAATALPAAAQDTVIVLRPDVATYGTPSARRAVFVFNAETTRRVFGGDTIAAGEEVRGDVAVFGGPLRIEGTVLGDVVAINANLTIAAGSEIRGDVLVFGGELSESLDARLLGTLEHHSSLLAVRRVGDWLELIETAQRTAPRDRSRRLPRSWRSTSASIVFSTGGTYNRVEGLPIHLGPRLSWTGPRADMRIEGFGIFRTAAGFDTDRRELGYLARGRLRLGRERIIELNASAYDVVAPVEDWTLHDDEIGLASFLFQRDYRDYFLERGVAGELRVYPTGALALFGGVARIEATSAAERDPWTLFRNSDVWRPNPAIDGGAFTELTAGVAFDTRRRGWGPALFVRAEWERGIGGDVTPRVLPLAVRDPVPATDWTYDRGCLDVRWYQPAGFGGLSLRAVGAGTLGGDPLPVQRRLSLGGPDPLPGYTFRRVACNGAAADPAAPALCDRMLLFQAEYRGGLDVDFFDWDHRAHRSDHPDRRDRRGWDWGGWDWDGPEFVFFANAGTAWLADHDDGPGALHWDVGAGLEFGGVGLYAARAIAADEPIRIVLRLHRRF